MASSVAWHIILLSCLISSLASLALAKPHALVLPVRKDPQFNQYVTRISSRTPTVDLDLVVDLGGLNTWLNCDTTYASWSYRNVLCNTPQCSLTGTAATCGSCWLPPAAGCTNQSCTVNSEGPTSSCTPGQLVQDVFDFSSTDGSGEGPKVTTGDFMFSCVPSYLLRGLASGAKGMLSLGRSRIGSPLQLAAQFQLRAKFAICFSSSILLDGGAIFIGDGPYRFRSFGDDSVYIDASQLLTYTPLIVNPVSTHPFSAPREKSVEHFIGVQSIRVNKKAVPLNAALLSINKQNGVGGTKISTMTPYTVLETSIYKAVTKAFAAAYSNSKPIQPIAPFQLCYAQIIGAQIPTVDLELRNMQNETVYWTLSSVVPAQRSVYCSPFLDGGERPRTSIVIGGYHLEDNLLQFDLANRKMGFTSSSLNDKSTGCSRFNYKAKAAAISDA